MFWRAALVLVPAVCGWAQQPVDLGADRPGFGVSSAVVPPGVLQIESGFSLSSEGDATAATRTVVVGSPVLRIGLIRALELRLDGDGFRSETSLEAGAPSRTVRGLSDFEVGAKIAVLSERHLRPAIALLPSFTLPVGSPGLTASAVNPSLYAAWSKHLPASLSLSGNLVAASSKDEQGRFLSSAESLNFGFPLAGKLAGYVEVYQVTSPERGAGSTRIFDGGLSRPLGARMQVDLQAGHTLHSSRPSWFVAMGFVYRARNQRLALPCAATASMAAFTFSGSPR
jgi:hypothetical protein